MLLSSDNFYLRTLSVNDVSETYLAWINNPEINRFLEVRHSPQTLETLRDFVANFDNVSKFFFGLFDAKSDQHIGNFNVHRNIHYNTVYFGYFIGDQRYWGSSAATEAICLVLDFSFEKLNARRVWGSTYASNLGAIFNLRKFGFTHEGTQREHYLDSGKPIDGLEFGLLRQEWIEKRHKFNNIMRRLE